MNKKKVLKLVKNKYWILIVLTILAATIIALKYFLFPNIKADTLVSNQFTTGIAKAQNIIYGYNTSVKICDAALACYKQAKTKSDQSECLERPGSSLGFSSLADLKNVKNQYLNKIKAQKRLIASLQKSYSQASTAKRNTEMCLAEVKQTYDYCHNVQKPNKKAASAVAIFNKKYESIAINYKDDLNTINVYLNNCKAVKNARNAIKLKGGCGK